MEGSTDVVAVLDWWSDNLNTLAARLRPPIRPVAQVAPRNERHHGTGMTGLNISGVSFQGLVSGSEHQPDRPGVTGQSSSNKSPTCKTSRPGSFSANDYKTIQSTLLALQSAANSLSSTYNSVFDGRHAHFQQLQPGDRLGRPATLSAGRVQFHGQQSGAGKRLPPRVSIRLSTITQGTFQFQVGSGAVNTITIDGTNNTLQGLTNAINNANAGVTATSSTTAVRLRAITCC